MTSIRKAYVETPDGQIHRRSLGAGDATLVCLHPAPYSGAYFETVMPLMAGGRTVIAPDYPGYGGSYRLHEPPAIGDYADAMLAAHDDQPVDLLGFHSGCLVAAEMALRAPARVRRLLLIDIPYFDSGTQQTFYGLIAKPLDLDHDLESLRKAWDFNVGDREGVVPLERALQMFVDQLGSSTRDWYCFHAAFTYDCIGRFADITTPTTIIATQSPLQGATRAAAEAISDAMLIEDPGITTSVFEQGAESIAAHIGKVLDHA